MSFGTQLRQARKRRRLTQKALADAIGVKHNSVSNWESDGKRRDPEPIRALCALLEVDYHYCLETDPMESQLSGVEFAGMFWSSFGSKKPSAKRGGRNDPPAASV